MVQALYFIPLIISSLALAVVSFIKKTKRNKKILWLITAFIVWLGVFIWTLKTLQVIIT